MFYHLFGDLLGIFDFPFRDVLLLQRLTVDGCLALGKRLTTHLILELHLQLPCFILPLQFLLLLELLHFPNASLLLPLVFLSLVLLLDSQLLLMCLLFCLLLSLLKYVLPHLGGLLLGSRLFRHISFFLLLGQLVLPCLLSQLGRAALLLLLCNQLPLCVPFLDLLRLQLALYHQLHFTLLPRFDFFEVSEFILDHGGVLLLVVSALAGGVVDGCIHLRLAATDHGRLLHQARAEIHRAVLGAFLLSPERVSRLAVLIGVRS